jgi:hypothetical protein
MSKLPARSVQLGQYGSTKVHHLPDWNGYNDPRKLQVIRQIAMERGRHPLIAKKAVSIFRRNRVQPRQYKKQAAALLKWVQDPKNIYYVNEPGERLVDPLVTLKWKFGDCDDQVMVLCSMFESVRLPWKLVICGVDKNGKKVRHIEGGKYPPGVKWTHIYCMVGTPAFSPNKWYFCESTVRGVPLGWDVVDGDPGYIPEMDRPKPGKPKIMKLPPKRRRTKARVNTGGYGSAIAGALSEESLWYGPGNTIGGAIAEDELLEGEQSTDKKENEYYNVLKAIGTGVAVAVGTQLTLDWIRGSGIWEEKDPGFQRLKTALGKYLTTPLQEDTRS